MAKKVSKKSAKPTAKKPAIAKTKAQSSAKKKPAAKPATKPARAATKANTPAKATAKIATTRAPAKKVPAAKVVTKKAAALKQPKTPAAPKAPKTAKTPTAKVAKKTASKPAPTLALPKQPAAAAIESKPSTKLPAKPAVIDVPLYPIAPASGQRDVDLATAIQKSRMFFATHGLGALASAIPTASDFPQEAHAAIEDAHAVGLDDVFVFPPVALQRTSLDHLVHKLAAAHGDRLESDQQYSQPWIYQPEALKTFDVHGRPAGAYALCFHSSPFPAATLGKDADELREWLTQRRSASLTAYEYLVLQRLKAEQHADHRFDLNAKTPTSQWHWLLDMSLGHGKDAKVPMAGWNPKLRRIDLGWCGPRDTDPAKGTIATRVVPALVAVPTPAPTPATPSQPTV
jgi:hypothetical protein